MSKGHNNNTKSSPVIIPQAQSLSTSQGDLNACNINAVNILMLDTYKLNTNRR